MACSLIFVTFYNINVHNHDRSWDAVNEPQSLNPRCRIGIWARSHLILILFLTAAHWNLVMDGLLLIVPRTSRGGLGIGLLLERGGVRAVGLLLRTLVGVDGRQRGRDLTVECKVGHSTTLPLRIPQMRHGFGLQLQRWPVYGPRPLNNI